MTNRFYIQERGLHNSWLQLNKTFETIDAAKNHIESKKPNKFGYIPEMRIVHYETIDNNTIREIIDFTKLSIN